VGTTPTQVCHTYSDAGNYEVHLIDPFYVSSLDLSGQQLTNFWGGQTTVLQNLDLRNNTLSYLSPTTFSRGSASTNVLLDWNCIDTSVNFSLPSGLSNGNRKNNQKACPIITYHPAASTVLPVLGTIGFVGKVESINTLNTSNSVFTHIWMENGTRTFDFSDISNS
jgi:hypothetical protein